MSDDPARTSPDPSATPPAPSEPPETPPGVPYLGGPTCRLISFESGNPPRRPPHQGLGLRKGLQLCDALGSSPSASSTAAADVRELEGHTPTPLDFTVYRQTTRRLADCTEVRDEPTGISVPDAVRNAILEHAELKSIHIYDGPYACGPLYGFDPPPTNAFYVHYRIFSGAWFIGRGNVMIFSHTGAKLYDGSDGGE
jgi:hypothetical protein